MFFTLMLYFFCNVAKETCKILLREVNSVLTFHYLIFPFPVPRYATYIDPTVLFGSSLVQEYYKINFNEIKYTKQMCIPSVPFIKEPEEVDFCKDHS